MHKKAVNVWVFTVLLLVTLTSTIKQHQKLNECRRCQIFSDSFIYWFNKTSRGKFEGGNAAWEESKQKSYAQSEVRLVEIQEKLCSELFRHDDECYSVAEESEHLVEKWWTVGNLQLSNLFSWLCIENLEYCCPEHHYGETCTPCPIGEDNKICNNQGVCNGDGTRKGDGTCICNTGYAGEHCNQCARNYYSIGENECRPCHIACQECSSYGSDQCKVCAVGWEELDGGCYDINECRSDSVCKNNQYCINNEGSFLCKYCDSSCVACTGSGPYNCTTCKHSEELWSGKCIDEEAAKNLLLYANKRLFMYSSSNILLYLFCRKSKPLSFVGVVALSIFIFKLEAVSDITVKDAIQNHLNNLLKSNELM